MHLISRFSGALLISAALMMPALGDEDADAVEGYAKTGEAKNCLSLGRIRTTQVLDGQHILFKMRGGRDYLNTLSHVCSQLDFYESFAYKTSSSQLCSVDTITVLTGGAVLGPTCGLGKFEEVEKAKEDPA